MNKSTIDKLKKDYESSCNEYLKQFCKKQGFQDDGWVNNDVGGIAMCSDFFFNLHDIIWDINSGQKKGFIVQWYDYSLNDPKNYVNYTTYTKL